MPICAPAPRGKKAPVPTPGQAPDWGSVRPDRLNLGVIPGRDQLDCSIFTSNSYKRAIWGPADDFGHGFGMTVIDGEGNLIYQITSQRIPEVKHLVLG
ncbi:hypothetical protein KDI_49910 [Dictyobacter arantiisoli]|uniref:Uncharacterized protein n=1 Tax=Dictyobacter arantiisoli TaxID=2014874 RepID=A0A5A5TJ32_9CHLR|nr:hypothetical protein KDI_49910 [Dictyobacter arantiisoli]